MKVLQIILFTFLINTAQSQDSVITTQLLQRINQLQTKESGVFPKGLFPSYRTYALNKSRSKADVNIFFTGLIAMTLKDIKPHLTSSQIQLADQIITNGTAAYSKFQNQKGRNTYNFWPTDTPKIFPNSGWMNRFDKSQALPDDVDDTVIMLLAMNASDSVAKQIHALMQQFTNSGQKRAHNTFKNYQNITAYSTWFGKKMPIELDVCVLANVLYFVQRYNLTWTAADSASLHLIEKMLDEKKHITHAAYISPQYGTPSIILYHLSRLMAVKPIPSLEKFRPQLIKQAQTALLQTHNFMNEVILSTALMRWDASIPTMKVHNTESLTALIEEGNFSYFLANMASIFPNPLKQWMGGLGVCRFYYDCAAYNNVLLLEYLICKKKRDL